MTPRCVIHPAGARSLIPWFKPDPRKGAFRKHQKQQHYNFPSASLEAHLPPNSTPASGREGGQQEERSLRKPQQGKQSGP